MLVLHVITVWCNRGLILYLIALLSLLLIVHYTYVPTADPTANTILIVHNDITTDFYLLGNGRMA